VAETLEEARPDRQSVALRPSGLSAIVLCLSVLAAICAATAYAVPDFGHFAEHFRDETALVPIPDPAVTAALKDIQLSQQQSAAAVQLNAAALESLTQSSTAQRSELKRIFDQLSSLGARMNALQNAAAPATTSTIPQPSARREVRKSSKKPSQVPKPSGPISVGGVPLSRSPVPRSGAGQVSLQGAAPR
jgi:uncharacterized coiled-coil protein SlyX